MEEINWHEEPVGENGNQSLGRMLVPTGQTGEEKPKRKRRQKSSAGSERRRLIVHVVILVVLLAIIIFGIINFFSEGKHQTIPQPKQEQADNIPQN